MEQKTERAIITVIGSDRVGIIAGVSTILADANVNILDITQTIMQGFFTMIMVVDISKAGVNLRSLPESSNRKARISAFR
jgi:ACT domain-containing protein